MGEFDCYCAICGGSLRWVEIGSANPRALERRDGHVSKKRLRMQNGADGNDSDSESEEEEDVGDHDTETEGDEWYPEDEDRQYDPRLVSDESTAWLSDARCLGFKSDADGTSRAFVTGSASYDDAGAIEVSLGTDSAQPTEAEYDCYESCEQSRMVVFPFHPPCFVILARVISPSGDIVEIDKDVLFDTMSRFTRRYKSYLDIDYGAISGIDQCWEPVPGEEFSVTNPLHVDDFRKHLSEIVIPGFEPSPGATTARDSTIARYFSHKNDPFARLPSRILRYISGHLEGGDLLAFSRGSRSLYDATCDNDFWKRIILNEMNWLWDMKDLLNEESITQLDCKALYVWLDNVTTPTYGVEPPFLAIANRRRIWNAARQLEVSYSKIAKRTTHMKPNQDIAEKARCSYMVKVANNELLRDVNVYKCFWVHSWDEIDDCPVVIETFWNEKDVLTGIGLAVGTSRRMLGSDTTRLERSKRALRLNAGQWISEMHLHLKLANDSSEENFMAIIGVSIVLQNNVKHSLGETNSTSGIRPLVVSDDQCLVGITGQIDLDGTITRLGILESSKEPTRDPEPTINGGFDANKAFWGPSYMVPTRGASYSISAPIWSHPSLGFLPVFPDPMSDSEENLEPYEILLWAKDIQELSKLCRISAHVENGLSGARVLGFTAEYIRRYWEPKRHIGQKRNEAIEGNRDDEIEKPTTDLIIDGPSGEIITEIGVSQGKEELTGFMLGTDQGKTAVIGESSQVWAKHSVPDGRCIIGIAASFLSTNNPEERNIVSLIMLHLPVG